MKKYIAPETLLEKINVDEEILASWSQPLGGDGGDGSGAGGGDAKVSLPTYSAWDDEEE
jgi:hypothetical protein